MKKIVIFSSLTGNTQKVANSIANALNCKSVNYTQISLDELGNYDFIAVGFYMDKGDMDSEFKAFATQIKSKKLGLFITMGTDANSQYAQKAIDGFRAKFISQNNEILTTFCSQGAIDPKIIEKMREMAAIYPNNERYQITPDREARWLQASTHPDETDLNNAKKAFLALKI